MNKIEMMDKQLGTYSDGITSTEICDTVDSIFKFNLDKTPLLSTTLEEVHNVSILGNNPTPREVIDLYINQYQGDLTGKEIRRMINVIFGVNLAAISSLETARISLYSKGKWVVQSEKDLFVVYTGAGDVDVKIYPTNYFTEQTGLTELPVELKETLTSLGYYFDEALNCYYYCNPIGEAISDAFKGKTMGAILNIIKQLYSDL